MTKIEILVLSLLCGVMCKPFGEENTGDPHAIQKRFIDTAQTFGSFNSMGLSKIRTRRSEEEDCEKLRLCKLHAQANRNFISAFELYFVNRENARLWDHNAHSVSDCYRRFSSCYRRR